MRTLFASESCKETPLNTINPQSWLQVERGKLSKSTSYSPSSIESIIKVPEPQILPFFKPIDYVQVLAQIHEDLESCLPQEKSALYLLQYQVFKGLGENKLMRRSLKSAYTKAGTVYDKIIFSAWLKYEKRGEDIIFDLLGGNNNEFPILDIASELPQNFTVKSPRSFKDTYVSKTVSFKIGDKKIECNRQKIANLSTPFHTMLNGCFSESSSEEIDLSENNISFSGMCVIRDFSINGTLNEVSPTLLLEILIFANKYCCEGLKDACDRKLSRLVSSKEDAIELMECALDESCPVLAASCLQVFLTELPDSLTDNQVVELLTTVNKHKKLTMVGSSTFSLYCLLSEVSLNLNPMSDKTVLFLKNLVEASETSQQKMMSYHQLGYVLYLRKEYEEAQKLFESAFNEGHVYSIVGLSRLNENSQWSYEKLTAVISNNTPLGWMYQERSLYGSDDSDLESATQLDPTLTYPYMYRAASLMKKHNYEGALSEINRVLGFKLALECLELRFCFYLAIEDYKSALCDIQAILTLSPDYRMFDNKVAATQLRTLVREHVENWTTADCWLQLYDTWSSVDDIGSLSVIYQMLESDSAKGVLYFRQSLLLLRLNSPEAAMRSLQLARKHATSEHERLVYEGWILYDTGHCEEGLKKAEESIKLKRSFEAYFLKAYALADSSVDPSCSATVISLLNEALKCPSDRLRKGQALNNLGSIHVDCNELDEAADCYINALKIRHTRAHQGLARVHYLKNDKKAAYEEMTKLIEKARNNASAYEKRSEYCERDLTRADLEMVTKLDPLRVYPYRYRAAVLMDNHNAEEAIGVLSKAIAFKADLHLLHLRAAFYEYTGNVSGALRDCRAALSVDPNHQEMLELHSRVNSQEP